MSDSPCSSDRQQIAIHDYVWSWVVAFFPPLLAALCICNWVWSQGPLFKLLQGIDTVAVLTSPLMVIYTLIMCLLLFRRCRSVWIKLTATMIVVPVLLILIPGSFISLVWISMMAKNAPMTGL